MLGSYERRFGIKMARRGRKKKTLLGNREDRLRYFRNYYKQHKANKPDYQCKTGLLVRVTQCLPKTSEQVNRYNPALRFRLHRFNYYSLSGSETIPEEYLSSNYLMAEFMSNILGTGEFIITAGYRHKCSKRCTWRALIRFQSLPRPEGGYRVVLIKVLKGIKN